MFYAHGGAFSLLSKDTHWIMGLAFARHGYLVVSVDATGKAPAPVGAWGDKLYCVYAEQRATDHHSRAQIQNPACCHCRLLNRL